MRILVLNQDFPPMGGGASNANYYTLKEFAKNKNILVDLVTSSVKNNFQKVIFSEKVTIYRLNISKQGNLDWTFKEISKWTAKAYLFSKKLVKKNKYDLIICYCSWPSGIIGYRLNKKFDVPYIVLLRGSDVPFHNPRFKFLDNLIFSKLVPKVWKNAKKVIANSEGLKNKALETSKNQDIIVVPNGIDANYFKPIKRIENKIIRIIYTGKLKPVKGLDFLLKSIYKLSKDSKEGVLFLHAKTNIAICLPISLT